MRRSRAKIYAEIIGFAVLTAMLLMLLNLKWKPCKSVWKKALRDAQLPAERNTGYHVSAHGTATEKGDIAESNATANIFGEVPISS
ncbi:hypothetical protein OK016_13885 [Vibrio chagasii]|nr:hypothetical protein [Vibrio chagasii]